MAQCPVPLQRHDHSELRTSGADLRHELLKQLPPCGDKISSCLFVATRSPSCLLWRRDLHRVSCGDEIPSCLFVATRFHRISCGDEISSCLLWGRDFILSLVVTRFPSCLLWRRDFILSILQVEKLAATSGPSDGTMAGDFVMDSALVAWSGPSRFHMGNPSLKLRTVGAGLRHE